MDMETSTLQPIIRDLPAAEPRRDDTLRRRSARRLRWNTPWSDEMAVTAMIAMDFLAIIVAGLLSWLVFARSDGHTVGAYLAASATAGIAIVAAMSMFQLYAVPPERQPLRVLERLLLSVGMAFAFLTMASLSVEAQIWHAFSWKVSFFVSSVALLFAERVASPGLLALLGQKRLVTRNVVIVGAGMQGEQLLSVIEKQDTPWTRIVGFFDDRSRNNLGRIQRVVGGFPVLGDTRDLICFARRFRVDEIFIALPWNAEKRIRDIVDVLRVIPADIHLSPEIKADPAVRQEMRLINGLPTIRFASKPINGWAFVGKWLLDKTAAAVGLLLLSPLFVLVAIAIKLDSPGPVFFRQKRLGFRNRTFDVYKFRSMYNDKADANADKLATRNDPRISRVGRILRRTSIDELPQLINVLRGDMSIVGPRPHALNAKAAGQLYQEVVAEYALRHRIKPGITGWAQMHGWRGETDTEEKIIKRVEHDLFYIDNWSLLLDMYIIAGTALKAPFQKTAY